MKISIIIPTYGIPVFLKRTIYSVINQTIKDWELIIVDDNNPDSEARCQTENIVESLICEDNRIKYIKHEYNKNGAVARNTGFAAAKGKYISLLDSDDEYMPNRLEKCYNIMEHASNNIAAVYTGCEFRRNGATYKRYTDVKPGNYIVETLACSFMLGTGSNIFIKKSVVDELNGFDPSFLRQQDYEFMVRVFEKYSIEAVPEILVIKNNENFNLPDVGKQIAIRNQYLNKFNYIISKLSRDKQNYIYYNNFINIAENAMASNNFKIANEYYRKASKFRGLSVRVWLRRLIFPLYNIIKKHSQCMI